MSESNQIKIKKEQNCSELQIVADMSLPKKKVIFEMNFEFKHEVNLKTSYEQKKGQYKWDNINFSAIHLKVTIWNASLYQPNSMQR